MKNFQDDSLTGRIYFYLQEKKAWIPSYEIETFARKNRYMAGTGTRRARSLAESGDIKVKHVMEITKHNGRQRKVKIAYYHY
jgi:hypothetical protein